MKKFITLLSLLLILPVFSALSLDVKQISSDNVMVLDFHEPTTIDIEIKNKGSSANLMFYTFFSPSMYPKGTVPISSGETKQIELQIYPPAEADTGSKIIKYYIRDGNSEIEEELSLRITDLTDAFEIGAENIDPLSNSVELYIKNKVNYDFGKINAKFSSVFFSLEKNFELNSNEQKKFIVELNKEDFEELTAGHYTLSANLDVKDKSTKIESTINFEEQNIIESKEDKSGFLIVKNKIHKENKGNVVQGVQTVVKKNVISRLFTSFSPEPNNVDRQGLKVYYSWTEELLPGEKLNIVVKTNSIYPFLFILLVVGTVVFTKRYLGTDLKIKKKIKFVKSKGGEFALKVSLIVSARKSVNSINLIERLPHLVKLYEKFDKHPPKKIDEKRRRLEWNIDRLEAREKRVFSYIIYSKVGVLGKFALPRASAVYERDSRIKEASSNRTYFVVEPKKEIE